MRHPSTRCGKASEKRPDGRIEAAAMIVCIVVSLDLDQCLSRALTGFHSGRQAQSSVSSDVVLDLAVGVKMTASLLATRSFSQGIGSAVVACAERT